MKISKVIIPVAGKGTRFLPVTKSVPKELIPILNRPMISYVVEEAVLSGIEEIIFITSPDKSSVESYFMADDVLDNFLKNNGKGSILEDLNSLINKIKIKTVIQEEALGLGHAIAQASSCIHESENFAVILPDDIVQGKENPCLSQLIKVSKDNDGAPVIGVMKIKPSETHKYGVIDGQNIAAGLTLMKAMVEKPSQEEAPSLLATPGRYILPAEIFKILKTLPKGSGGEYQLTDAINQLCQVQKVFAYEFEGKRYDTGQLPGYLEATIDFALQDPHLKTYMLELMEKKIKNGV